MGMEQVEEKSAKRDRVTQSKYFAYRLLVHLGSSLLHSRGTLFQQCDVDAYVKLKEPD